MPDLSPDHPVLFLGALWREVSGIASLLAGRRQVHSRTSRGTAGTASGQRVLVAAGGVGRDGAVAAAQELLDLEGPTALVNVGFAGSLQGDLDSPTLVLPETILHNGSEVNPAEDLLALADEVLRDSGMPYRRGRLVTVDHLLGRQVEKRRVGIETGAVAAEMEAFFLGDLARERGVPFLCVKVILDGLEDDLPGPSFLLSSGGEPSASGVLHYLLRHPREVGKMLTLARADSKGRSRITSFARSFLDRRGPGDPQGARADAD